MPTSNEDAHALLQSAIPDADITVTGDGYKYQARVVSAEFEGLSLVKRHQRVYAALNRVITTGALHALTIDALTPDEADTQSKEISGPSTGVHHPKED